MTTPVAFSLFDNQPEWTEVALVIGVAFVFAGIVSTVLARLVRAMLKAIYGDTAQASPRLVSRPVFVTRLITFLLVFFISVVPLLDAIGDHLDVGLGQREALHWAIGSGLRIAVIVTIAWLMLRVVTSTVNRLEQEVARRHTDAVDERLKRAQTLGALVQNTANAVVISIALLMVLNELNINVLPMLTGAGIAGVALGFGAQWLVRDLIAGFFLILEDQVRVGDSVVINGQGGTVEAVNLRTLVLRDVEGAVHVFPNGAVNTLANKTRDYAFALVDLALDFGEDSDRVIRILRETADELQAEPVFGSAIQEPLEVLGIEGFRDGQTLVRARMKTIPQRQAEVGRELRRRLRIALDAAGISLAVPPYSRVAGPLKN
jgi:small-conductance mechanosensitive channel